MIIMPGNSCGCRNILQFFIQILSNSTCITAAKFLIKSISTFPINLLLSKKQASLLLNLSFCFHMHVYTCSDKNVSANNTIQIHFIDTSKLYTEIVLQPYN